MCDLPDFIKFLVDAIEDRQTRKRYGVSDDHYSVLVLADQQDAALGDTVGEQLETFGPCADEHYIEAILFMESIMNVGKRAGALTPRGLVVVWDKGSEDLLIEFMKKCRRYKRNCPHDPPACAVVVPSLISHPVNYRPVGFKVISKNDLSDLQHLAKRICGDGP